MQIVQSRHQLGSNGLNLGVKQVAERKERSGQRKEPTGTSLNN